MDELLVACFVGADYTVFADFAPQGTQKPYAVYSVISNTRDNHANGQGNLKEVRYQIEVFDAKKSVAEDIAANIESRLLACADFEAYIYQSFGDVEDETKAYRSVLDFKLWK